MALTSGDRKNKATVSSIQSRMGVVDTYSGESPIGLAAQNVSSVLDVFAEREAKREEIKYKTDFKLAARKKGQTGVTIDQLTQLQTTPLNVPKFPVVATVQLFPSVDV